MHIKYEINKSIDYAKQHTHDYLICFIANVDGYTDIKDFRNTKDTILTEYFTEDEYNTILNALRDIGYNVKVFFNELDFIEYANNIPYKNNIIVFNLARNGTGLCKKALIPSYCEFQGILHSGSDAYTVCLGRHKYHYNKLLSAFNLNVVDSWLFTSNGWLFNEEPPLGTMIIIKPTYESASRGIRETSIFKYSGSHEDYYVLKQLYNEFQQDIIVQKFIRGYEIQVPIIMIDRPYALNTVGIAIKSNKLIGESIITYDIAFSEEYSFYIYNENTDQIKRILSNSEKIAQIFNIKNYGRCDYRIDENGNFYLTDISTHPYLIFHSAFAFIFKEMGYKYTDIFAHLIGNILINTKDE